MRVPGEDLGVAAAQADFHKRHAALDQPPRQQTALAELVAAVGVAQDCRLFVQVKRLGGRRAHEPHRPIVRGLVAQRGHARVHADEIPVQAAQQVDTCGRLVEGHFPRRFQVLDLQVLLIVILPLTGRLNAHFANN